MFGQLVPCGGGNPIPLRLRRSIIGRALECDIVLTNLLVSAKHCMLEIRDGIWSVSDLASSNGIAIDGERCREGQLLPGSILTIAKSRYVVEYAAEGVTAPLPVSLKRKAVISNSNSELKQPRIHPNGDSPLAVNQHDGGLGELIPCGGGTPIPLRKRCLIIGRSPSCDIVIGFPKVSGKHCQLDFHLGYWHVRDLGSLNGIRVDGSRQIAKALMPGAILSIAEHRYQLAYAGASAVQGVAPVDEEPTAAIAKELTSPPSIGSDVDQECGTDGNRGS